MGEGTRVRGSCSVIQGRPCRGKKTAWALAPCIGVAFVRLARKARFPARGMVDGLWVPVWLATGRVLHFILDPTFLPLLYCVSESRWSEIHSLHSVRAQWRTRD